MAGATIGSMNVSLGLNHSKFGMGLKKASGSVASFGSRVRGSMGSVLRFGGALGALAAGAGLTAMVKGSLSAIDANAKLSKQIGISTENLSGLQHAAEITGAGGNKLSAGLAVMSKRLGEAAAGSGSAVRGLEMLGLSASDLIGMSPDQQFAAIGDAMNKISDPATKNAATALIFSRANQDLVNTLALGKDGMAAMVAEATKLGIAYSAADAAKVEEANDALTRMRAVFTGLSNQLAIGLAPAIESIGNGFAAWASQGVGLAEMVKGWMANIHAFFQTLRLVPIFFERAYLGAALAASSAFDTIWAAGAFVMGNVPIMAENLGIAFKTAFSNIAIIATNLFTKFPQLLKSFGDIWVMYWSNYWQIVKNVGANIKNLFWAVFEAIRTQSLDPFSQTLTVSLTKGTQNMVEPLLNIADQLTEGTVPAKFKNFAVGFEKKDSLLTTSLRGALNETEAEIKGLTESAGKTAAELKGGIDKAKPDAAGAGGAGGGAAATKFGLRQFDPRRVFVAGLNDMEAKKESKESKAQKTREETRDLLRQIVEGGGSLAIALG